MKTFLRLTLPTLASLMVLTEPMFAAEFIVVPSFASGVRLSDDGKVAFGSTNSSYDPSQAPFRWDPETGIQLLEILSGLERGAVYGVSKDGTTAAGTNFRPARDQPFLWTVDNGVERIEVPEPFEGGQIGPLSGDGLAAAGTLLHFRDEASGDHREAFRWTREQGIEQLGLLDGYTSTGANFGGITADGTTIAGTARRSLGLSGFERQAFVWTESDGMRGLGFLPGTSSSGASSISANGEVVVGTSGDHGFRWTITDGMQKLESPNNLDPVSVRDVNLDGSIIVGSYGEFPTNRAFLWDSENGSRDLYDVLSYEHGLQSLFAPTSTAVNGISSDGRVINGVTVRNGRAEGWIIKLDRSVVARVQAGDADQDLDFDQLDLVQVQVAGKYLTGRDATWGEGDWNKAPRMQGDGVFDQNDIVAALQANVYLTGPYAAQSSSARLRGDVQTDLVYNAATGGLSVEAPAGMTSINMTSDKTLFIGDKPKALGDAFNNFEAVTPFNSTFGGSFGSIGFGSVSPAGISEYELVVDISAADSPAGGGDLGNVDLVYAPEPTSVLLLFVGLAIGLVHSRRVAR